MPHVGRSVEGSAVTLGRHVLVGIRKWKVGVIPTTDPGGSQWKIFISTTAYDYRISNEAELVFQAPLNQKVLKPEEVAAMDLKQRSQYIGKFQGPRDTESVWRTYFQNIGNDVTDNGQSPILSVQMLDTIHDFPNIVEQKIRLGRIPFVTSIPDRLKPTDPKLR